MRDLTYPPIIGTCKVLFRGLGLTFQTSGTEHVPRSGGALIAFNHVSYLDFIFGGDAPGAPKRPVPFIGQRGTLHPPGSRPPVGPVDPNPPPPPPGGGPVGP